MDSILRLNLSKESSTLTAQDVFQLDPRTFLLILSSLIVSLLFLRRLFSPSKATEGPLSGLSGPKRENWLTGNRLTGKDKPPGLQLTEYQAEFGRAWVYPDGFGTERLFISDYKALNAVLGDTTNFQSDAIRAEAMKFTVGNGIITRYGAEHKNQRKILGPAFSASQLRALSPVFLSNASALSDKMELLVQSGGEKEWTKSPSDPIVDMVQWLNCAALDVIGATGFGVDFGALQHGDEHSPMARSFKKIVAATVKDNNIGFFSLLLLSIVYPKAFSWRLIERNRVIHSQNKFMATITDELVRKKSDEIKQEMALEGKNSSSEVFAGKKDLLHLLLKSNMDPSLKPSERMSLQLCRSQVQFFLFAGFETSSTTVTWALHYLSLHQEVQTSLREHISASLDLLRSDLESPQHKPLDNIILETLRLVLPVPYSERINVGEDTILPLSEPVIGKDGKVASIQIPKGTGVLLGLQQANLDERLYGPQPEEWRPSRWDSLPEAHHKANLPAYGLFSFLGGPKVCIGNRFAMHEMRAFLVELLCRFKFEPDPNSDIRAQYAVVTKPVVVQKNEVGMPLKVTRM